MGGWALQRSGPRSRPSKAAAPTFIDVKAAPTTKRNKKKRSNTWDRRPTAYAFALLCSIDPQASHTPIRPRPGGGSHNSAPLDPSIRPSALIGFMSRFEPCLSSTDPQDFLSRPPHRGLSQAGVCPPVHHPSGERRKRRQQVPHYIRQIQIHTDGDIPTDQFDFRVRSIHLLARFDPNGSSCLAYDRSSRSFVRGPLAPGNRDSN